MKLNGTKPIWISPIKFICLFVISMLIYAPLNHFGGSLAMHHGSIILLIFITLLTVALSIGMLFYMLKEQNKYSTIKYSVKHRILSVPLGIVSIFILLLISVFIMFASHVHLESLNQQTLMIINKTSAGSVYLLIMLIFSPVIEEFFFRFLIVGPNPIGNHLSSRLIYGLRIVIGIVSFSLIHVLRQLFVTGSVTSTLVNDLPYLAISCVLTYFYVHTQDIKVPIAIHVVWDLGLIILKDLT